MVTVDITAGSNRENTRRAGFNAPFRPTLRTFWDGLTHPRWSIGNFLTHDRRGTACRISRTTTAVRGAPIVSRSAIARYQRPGDA